MPRFGRIQRSSWGITLSESYSARRSQLDRRPNCPFHKDKKQLLVSASGLKLVPRNVARRCKLPTLWVSDTRLGFIGTPRNASSDSCPSFQCLNQIQDSLVNWRVDAA